jgi:serine protease Do
MYRSGFLHFAVVGVLSALITTVFLVGGLYTLVQLKPELVLTALQEVRGSNGTPVLVDAESRVVEVVRRTNPAVVAITVSKNVPVYERYYEQGPLGGFFGDFFIIPQIRQNGTQLQEVGGGSGFLVSEDGYIVTNRHVVIDENAEYTVFTNDGEQYTASVIARDAILDIAVIKIEGEGFEHVSFGDSDKIEVGQSVVAIGNALAEFRNTVSVGVVSGLSRSITASDSQGSMESLDQLIQTDAAINNGNSGGPLLNLDGEVIGVNVAVASGAENVGFALSGNSVKNIVETVKSEGRIIRPYLGVRYLPITEELKDKNNLSVDYGVLVQRGVTPEDVAVIPGSPADKAGIMENDIILELDGTKIDDEHSLASIINTKRVGDTVKLKIISKGKEREVTVELEEFKTQ